MTNRDKPWLIHLSAGDLLFTIEALDDAVTVLDHRATKLIWERGAAGLELLVFAEGDQDTRDPDYRFSMLTAVYTCTWHQLSSDRSAWTSSIYETI